MNSIVFRTVARLMVPLMLVFALFLLIRGHNQPGGGFIGGLVAASAFILLAMARDVEEARRRLYFAPFTWIGVGMLVALGSGCLALLGGGVFMSGLWGGSLPTLVAGPLKLGTPVLFDLGVFLIVTGVATSITFAFLEDH